MFFGLLVILATSYSFQNNFHFNAIRKKYISLNQNIDTKELFVSGDIYQELKKAFDRKDYSTTVSTFLNTIANTAPKITSRDAELASICAWELRSSDLSYSILEARYFSSIFYHVFILIEFNNKVWPQMLS